MHAGITRDARATRLILPAAAAQARCAPQAINKAGAILGTFTPGKAQARTWDLLGAAGFVQGYEARCMVYGGCSSRDVGETLLSHAACSRAQGNSIVAHLKQAACPAAPHRGAFASRRLPGSGSRPHSQGRTARARRRAGEQRDRAAALQRGLLAGALQGKRADPRPLGHAGGARRDCVRGQHGRVLVRAGCRLSRRSARAAGLGPGVCRAWAGPRRAQAAAV